MYATVRKFFTKSMKLRVRHNSIRLRLTQSETTRLAESGRIEETIEFGFQPNERFVYAIEKSKMANDISAVFENREIKVFVPEKQLDNWINTEQVGIEAEQNAGSGKTLRILIEKDFACLAPRRGEDDSDAFPHPPESKSC